MTAGVILCGTLLAIAFLYAWTWRIEHGTRFAVDKSGKVERSVEPTAPEPEAPILKSEAPPVDPGPIAVTLPPATPPPATPPPVPPPAVSAPAETGAESAPTPGQFSERSIPTAKPQAPAPSATPPGPPAVAPTLARVVIHYTAGDSNALSRARELGRHLRAGDLATVELRQVPMRVSTDNVRYFFDADEDKARAVHSVVARWQKQPGAPATVPISDFSHFRPLPRLGTIEIWLATAGLPAPVADPQSARR